MFSRTTSVNTEQSTDSMYNEAVKFKKAGLLQEAENKFRQVLSRDKQHIPSILGLGTLIRAKGDGEGERLLEQASGQIAGQTDVVGMMKRTQSMGGPGACVDKFDAVWTPA